MKLGIRNLEWSRRGARGLLVLIQVPIVMSAPVLTSLGSVYAPWAGPSWIPVLIGVAVFGLLVRLTLDVANGLRPRAGLLSLLLISLLSLVPLIWFPFTGWGPMIDPAMAAAVLVLRGWWAAGAVAAMAVPLVASYTTAFLALPTPNLDFLAFIVLSGLPGPAISVLAIWGGAQLVRSLDELHATRAELAQLAIQRERLRLSRDLHDLLGQSLSAVALKADLAGCLVDAGDVPAARVQAAELTAVARRAHAGLQDVTGGRDVVSLHEELASAAALLRVADIDAHLPTGEDLALPPPIDAALAWSVREGITNVLRHSSARTAHITVVKPDGLVRMEIVNDGVGGDRPGVGSGLRGLTGRVGELSGTLSAEFVEGGRFRLRVDIPLRR